MMVRQWWWWGTGRAGSRRPDRHLYCLPRLVLSLMHKNIKTCAPHTPPPPCSNILPTYGGGLLPGSRRQFPLPWHWHVPAVLCMAGHGDRLDGLEQPFALTNSSYYLSFSLVCMLYRLPPFPFPIPSSSSLAYTCLPIHWSACMT